MTSAVLLNNVEHKDVKVSVLHGAEYGDAVNQLVVFPNEFEELQREYPILFRKDQDGRFFSVVILGFDRDENLFLNNPVWNARYVPALRRRGPFAIGSDDYGEAPLEPMIYIDMADTRVGRDDGLPLFLPQGGNAPLLNHVLEAMQTIHLGEPLSGAMFAAFDELELIQPLQFGVNLSEDESISFPDVYGIDARRFAALGGDALARLHKGGFLGCAIWALSSLENMIQLITLKNASRAAKAQ
jgi:hypothetical protein